MVSWLSTVLAVVLVAVFYTDLPTYISVTYGTLVPYQWVLAFGVLALPLIIRHARTSQVLTSPVVGWCFLYLFVTILWFIPSAQSDIAWQEVRWRIMTVLSLMIFLILSGDAAFNRVIRTALVAAVLFGVALNVYEVFVPLSFSSVVGRSAGLYINPTTSGLALVGGMIIAVSVLPRRFRGLFVLLVGLGVVTTFARGGIIAWLLARPDGRPPAPCRDRTPENRRTADHDRPVGGDQFRYSGTPPLADQSFRGSGSVQLGACVRRTARMGTLGRAAFPGKRNRVGLGVRDRLAQSIPPLHGGSRRGRAPDIPLADWRRHLQSERRAQSACGPLRVHTSVRGPGLAHAVE
jgi:hypothetical protein